MPQIGEFTRQKYGFSGRIQTLMFIGLAMIELLGLLGFVAFVMAK